MIELSIAVVVGTAFTSLVTAFTTNIVNPIVAATGGVHADGLGFTIWPGNSRTFVNIGAVITSFVTFMITAAVVYFIFVAPMNRLNRMVKHRLATQEPEEEPLPADTALLAEIRDLLAGLAGSGGTAEHADDGAGPGPRPGDNLHLSATGPAAALDGTGPGDGS